jgi:hypothetical protein
MGFEVKVALLIWHGRQTPPFTPQSTISVEPSFGIRICDQPRESRFIILRNIIGFA